jgi:hypothetical protein
MSKRKEVIFLSLATKYVVKKSKLSNAVEVVDVYPPRWIMIVVAVAFMLSTAVLKLKSPGGNRG